MRNTRKIKNEARIVINWKNKILAPKFCTLGWNESQTFSELSGNHGQKGVK